MEFNFEKTNIYVKKYFGWQVVRILLCNKKYLEKNIKPASMKVIQQQQALWVHADNFLFFKSRNLSPL